MDSYEREDPQAGLYSHSMDSFKTQPQLWFPPWILPSQVIQVRDSLTSPHASFSQKWGSNLCPICDHSLRPAPIPRWQGNSEPGRKLTEVYCGQAHKQDPIRHPQCLDLSQYAEHSTTLFLSAVAVSLNYHFPLNLRPFYYNPSRPSKGGVLYQMAAELGLQRDPRNIGFLTLLSCHIRKPK